MNPLKRIFFPLLLFCFITSVKSYCQETYFPEKDTVRISDQIWSTRNLDIGVFRNGDTILHAPSLEEWVLAGEKEIPAWCYYNNDPELGKEAGRIYNWYAASDKRGLAPEGWRIPTSKDVEELLKFIGIDHRTSSRLASKEWENFAATDSYGFCAKPYGARSFAYEIPILIPDSIRFSNQNKFSSLGEGIGYWLSDLSKYNKLCGNAFLLNLQAEANVYGVLKENGFYIRCLKED